jgi:hypothetical protein
MLDNIRRPVRESSVVLDRIDDGNDAKMRPSSPAEARHTSTDCPQLSEDAWKTAFSERSLSLSPSLDPLAARCTMMETRSEDANR